MAYLIWTLLLNLRTAGYLFKQLIEAFFEPRHLTFLFPSLICTLVYFIFKWIFETCFLWSSSSIFLSMFCLCWIDDLMFFLQHALGRGSWKWSVWPTILHHGLNIETERDEENFLYSHYSFCTMQQSSRFWAVLGSRFLKNLPSPSPPVTSLHEQLFIFSDRSSSSPRRWLWPVLRLCLP